MLAGTQHDLRASEDYARLRELGITTVREGIRWPLIEREPGRFDFSSLDGMAVAAREAGVQVVWSFCHYGWPDDLDVFTPAFVDRFAAYCRATATRLAELGAAPEYFTPVNEISFCAWAAGEVGIFHPFAAERGAEVKAQLIRAAIAGTEAVWTVASRARTVTIEPLINVMPPKARPDLASEAAAYHASQFEAWDMLSGARTPELGGQPRYLDIVGVNFYHDNQWEHPGGVRIHWHHEPRDPRWVPFHQLLTDVFLRYKRPLCIAETSHVGSGRARWIAEMTDEVTIAVREGVPVEGVCLYPIIDRYDWENPNHWHHSGLWDLVPDADGQLRRVLASDYAAELRRSMRRLEETHPSGTMVGVGVDRRP